ncbi:MAG: PQQ-dependent sugar dehydrogenase [Gemmatimonadota bacterium]
MSRTLIASIAGVALAAGAPALAQPQAPVFDSAAGPYRVVTVAEGLDGPWSMAFLPDGDMLLTEKVGRLRIVRDGVLQPEPIAGTPEVRASGQGGLLDVALHPEFENNRLVYLSFSKPNADGSEGTTAVVRGRLDGQRLIDVEEIFEAQAWGTTGGHYGSRLAFDDEGYLFITIGDRMQPSEPGTLESHGAQDLSNHRGTIVRLHDDGRVPEDNPFVGQANALPEIWSYGHRSPQGLTFHPETGDLWESEHGPQGGDELNLILPGRNYGWPVVGYGREYGGTPIHAAIRRDDMEEPIHYFTPSIGTSGLAVYSGDAFPQLQGQVLMGGLVGRQLALVPLDGEDLQRVGRIRDPLLREYGQRIRDVRQGPDGFIYVAIDDRQGGGLTEIVRLEPAADEGSL